MTVWQGAYAVEAALEDLESARAALGRSIERPTKARGWRAPTQRQKLDVERAMRAIVEAQFLLNRIDAEEEAA